MKPDEIALIIYAAVAVIAVGVVREIEGNWDAVADGLPFIIAWPLVIAVAAAVAIGWCALWVVRGPIRIAIWLIDRRAARMGKTELPRAEIARRR
jgi:hypothetical protein